MTWASSRSFWTGEPTSPACGASMSRARPGRPTCPCRSWCPAWTAPSTCATRMRARPSSTPRVAPAPGSSAASGDQNRPRGRHGSLVQAKGQPGQVRTPLVVGADGRASTVRRQAGIELTVMRPAITSPGSCSTIWTSLTITTPWWRRAICSLCSSIRGTGELGPTGPAAAPGSIGSLVVMPPSGFWRPSPSGRFPGEQRCGRHPGRAVCDLPGDDTWTDRPFADGVILIGDAAGWNDPIIGQGLSIAMRDARSSATLLGGDTTPADLSYGQERLDRMRRLRLLADVVSVTFAEDADNRQARRAWMGERQAAMDPEVFPLVAGIFAGLGRSRPSSSTTASSTDSERQTPSPAVAGRRRPSPGHRRLTRGSPPHLHTVSTSTTRPVLICSTYGSLGCARAGPVRPKRRGHANTRHGERWAAGSPPAAATLPSRPTSAVQTGFSGRRGGGVSRGGRYRTPGTYRGLRRQAQRRAQGHHHDPEP